MNRSDTPPSGLYHICTAGTSAARVRTVVDDPTIEINDDCSIGPLQDIDTPCPRTRVAFWNEIFGSGGCHTCRPGFDPLKQLAKVHPSLVKLAGHRGALVIWAGSSLTEQTLRRRLHWWLRDVPATVLEARVPDDSRATAAGTPLAMLDAATLHKALDCMAVVSDKHRSALAHEWVELREHGGDLRVWKDGQLAGQPANHHDAQLLALAGNGPILLPRLTGEAMGTIGYSQVFWKWRVRQLVAQGLLQMVDGSPGQWQKAVVHVSE